MKKKNKRTLLLLGLALLVLIVLYLVPAPAPAPMPTAAPSPAETLALLSPSPPPQSAAPAETPSQAAALSLDEDGVYTGKEELALYLHTYGHLPANFITKTKARAAGWQGGSLEDVLPGMCIGGGGFNNLEGLLPDAPGRTWKECDVNTLGAKSRGAERLVYSNDGLIYYTGDHYESFELLYGQP